MKKVKKDHPDIKAVFVTHLFGIPCDIDTINKIAKKYKIKTIVA